MDQIKKIIIEGEKVHNVGYRPFLLRKARGLGIQNYDADNVVEDGQQRVVVSLGGDENQVRGFVAFVKENYPSKAKVSNVREVEPPERVMSIDEYDKVLAAEQQNTVVQAGLVMIDMQKDALGNQRKMLDKQDETIGAIDKLDVNVNRRFDHLDVKYGKIAEHMEKILEEMKEERKEARKSMERILNAILKLAEKSAE
ncbi:MAG: acylphosphatase [Candidatus Altiarchaeota archaeon]|nr:acylphosphatase [Candidatus Altiarchaeota archaeon]